ncbi:hypothetical protein QBC47DRAFT_391357 [Echria macrotheca]|uniref:Uncharacterized protein n=1 Tax=Echria macrotheca TaxID=438768 RepID=A0AAJ0B839_9PEZI|nr:hypothetical protein QBC47DRAFT_391357 [Echria macrotheca]
MSTLRHSPFFDILHSSVVELFTLKLEALEWLTQILCMSWIAVILSRTTGCIPSSYIMPSSRAKLVVALAASAAAAPTGVLMKDPNGHEYEFQDMGVFSDSTCKAENRIEGWLFDRDSKVRDDIKSIWVNGYAAAYSSWINDPSGSAVCAGEFLGYLGDGCHDICGSFSPVDIKCLRPVPTGYLAGPGQGQVQPIPAPSDNVAVDERRCGPEHDGNNGCPTGDSNDDSDSDSNSDDEEYDTDDETDDEGYDTDDETDDEGYDTDDETDDEDDEDGDWDDESDDWNDESGSNGESGDLKDESGGSDNGSADSNGNPHDDSDKCVPTGVACDQEGDNKNNGQESAPAEAPVEAPADKSGSPAGEGGSPSGEGNPDEEYVQRGRYRYRLLPKKPVYNIPSRDRSHVQGSNDVKDTVNQGPAANDNQAAQAADTGAQQNDNKYQRIKCNGQPCPYGSRNGYGYPHNGPSNNNSKNDNNNNKNKNEGRPANYPNGVYPENNNGKPAPANNEAGNAGHEGNLGGGWSEKIHYDDCTGTTTDECEVHATRPGYQGQGFGQKGGPGYPGQGLGQKGGPGYNGQGFGQKGGPFGGGRPYKYQPAPYQQQPGCADANDGFGACPPNIGPREWEQYKADIHAGRPVQNGFPGHREQRGY